MVLLKLKNPYLFWLDINASSQVFVTSCKHFCLSSFKDNGRSISNNLKSMLEGISIRLNWTIILFTYIFLFHK